MNTSDGIRFQRLINSHTDKFRLFEDGIIGSKTLEATKFFLTEQTGKRGFTMPWTGLIYIRTDESLTNSFDDFVVRINKGIVDYISICSTTAGDYYIYNPVTSGGVTGTAVTAEQQVKFSHKFVTGDWKKLWLNAPYFQQIKPLTIYRDGDKNRVLSKALSKVGLFGINLHRGGIGNAINNWSAGCNVTPDKDWYKIIEIFNNGDLMDYTLINLTHG